MFAEQMSSVPQVRGNAFAQNSPDERALQTHRFLAVIRHRLPWLLAPPCHPGGGCPEAGGHGSNGEECQGVCISRRSSPPRILTPQCTRNPAVRLGGPARATVTSLLSGCEALGFVEYLVARHPVRLATPRPAARCAQAGHRESPHATRSCHARRAVARAWHCHGMRRAKRPPSDARGCAANRCSPPPSHGPKRLGGGRGRGGGARLFRMPTTATPSVATLIAAWALQRVHLKRRGQFKGQSCRHLPQFWIHACLCQRMQHDGSCHAPQTASREAMHLPGQNALQRSTPTDGGTKGGQAED